jgi:demethoxyubiquinone hydroxylase (CLK1/Coq7/Cat5 family)
MSPEQCVTHVSDHSRGGLEGSEDRRNLVRLLRLAYSGEKAAAYAYAGHWRSVRDPAERATIQKIEQDEWHHRALVGQLLATLGERPLWWRELLMTIIGGTVAIGCFVTGRFIAMYLAGKLEHANVREYDGAAYYAERLGLAEFLPQLHEMTETELEHERFFSQASLGHPLLPLMKIVFGWQPEDVLECLKKD